MFPCGRSTTGLQTLDKNRPFFHPHSDSWAYRSGASFLPLLHWLWRAIHNAFIQPSYDKSDIFHCPMSLTLSLVLVVFKKDMSTWNNSWSSLVVFCGFTAHSCIWSVLLLPICCQNETNNLIFANGSFRQQQPGSGLDECLFRPITNKLYPRVDCMNWEPWVQMCNCQKKEKEKK